MTTIRLWDLVGAEDDRAFSPYCWRTKMALAHKGLAHRHWRIGATGAVLRVERFTHPLLGPIIADQPLLGQAITYWTLVFELTACGSISVAQPAAMPVVP